MAKSQIYRSKTILSLKNIYKFLEIDIGLLKDKDASSINFSSCFNDLKKVLVDVFNSELIKDSDIRNSPEFKYSLLAFALEIAKKPVSSFWKELFDQLYIEDIPKNRNLIFFNLWKTLQYVGIEPEKGLNGRKMLVDTLKMKVESDYKFIRDATLFFIDYYKNHRNEDIIEALKNFDKYHDYENKNKDGQFFIITQKLIKIVDFVIENRLNSLDDENKLNEDIIRNLGFDAKQYTRKRVSNLVKEVLNRLTPLRFAKILKENRQNDVVIPNGEKIKCSKLETMMFDYGIYKISDLEYHVTPDIRISLEQIKNWKYESIGHFKNFCYYKKKSYFKSSIGTIRKYTYDNESFYLWYGAVPIGEKYSLDGKYEIKEGFVWTPSLRLMWADEDDTISFKIEISKLNCYNPDKKGKELKICLNDQVKTFRLNSNGAFSERNIIFDLEGKTKDIVLTAYFDSEIIKESKFKVEESMLFSASTRKLIKGNNNSNIIKRTFGEYRYYLFSIYSKESIKADNSININQKGIFDHYNLYEVEWESNNDFLLEIKEFKWIFDRKKFVEWWFKNNENSFNSIKEVQIRVNSNMETKNSEEGFFLRILNKDHEPIMESFELDPNQFRMNFIIDGNYIFNQALHKRDLTPNEYVFELALNDLNYKRNFYIVPNVKIEWPKLMEENVKSYVKVMTLNGENVLFDPKTSKCINKLEIPIHCRTVLFNDKNKRFPVIQSEEISTKISFILDGNNQMESLIKSTIFITKEFFPDEKLSIFGYRIYIKNNDKYIKTDELLYYEIDNAVIFVFTKPGMIVNIKKSSKVIMSLKANFQGYCFFEGLLSLKEFCINYKTCFVIESEKVSKKMEVIWYPQVFSIKDPKLFENKLRLTLDYEGPSNSGILLKLMDKNVELESKVFQCYNLNESKKIEFELPFEIGKYLYILSYTLLNNEILPGKCLIWNNPAKTEVEISLDNETVKTSLNRFIENSIDVALLFLAQNKLAKLILPDKYTQKEFLELLCTINSNSQVLVPYNNQKGVYASLKEITNNRSCIKLIKDENNLENILNPTICKKVLKNGVMVSSFELIKNLKNYLPKPDPIIVVDSQELTMNEETRIINYCKDRTLILLERR